MWPNIIAGRGGAKQLVRREKWDQKSLWVSIPVLGSGETLTTLSSNSNENGTLQKIEMGKIM